MPGESGNVLLMALQEADVAHHAEIENSGSLVSGRSCQASAANLFKNNLGDGTLVAMESREAATGARIPQLDQVILGTRNKQALGRMPIDTLRIPTVTLELGFHLTHGKVEDLEGRVVTGSDKLGVVGAVGEVSNGVGVSVDALNVVEVWLPVLDDSVMVGRDEPIVAVRVFKSTDSRVVGLHDGFKVEARSVPQGELATSRGRQQSATLWCPANHIDRVLDFVQR